MLIWWMNEEGVFVSKKWVRGLFCMVNIMYEFVLCVFKRCLSYIVFGREYYIDVCMEGFI